MIFPDRTSGRYFNLTYDLENWLVVEEAFIHPQTFHLPNGRRKGSLLE